MPENTIISFIFYQPISNEVLLEKRLHKQTSPFYQKEIYPGEKMHPNETPTQTLFRGIDEEFSHAVTIKEYSQLTRDGYISGESGRPIVPFVITKWGGAIPSKNSDNSNEFVWRNVDDVLNETDLDSTRALTQALLGFIASQP